MTHENELVKLKRENSVLRNALAQIRQWLGRAFDDSQDFVDESQQYLSFINGVLNDSHEMDVDEFLCGTDDDIDSNRTISADDGTAA